MSERKVAGSIRSMVHGRSLQLEYTRILPVKLKRTVVRIYKKTTVKRFNVIVNNFG